VALCPLELVRQRGQAMLLFESTTARPLDKMIGRSLSVGTFLRLAIAATYAVARLHQRATFTRTSRPPTFSSIGRR